MCTVQSLITRKLVYIAGNLALLGLYIMPSREFIMYIAIRIQNSMHVATPIVQPQHCTVIITTPFVFFVFFSLGKIELRNFGQKLATNHC